MDILAWEKWLVNMSSGDFCSKERMFEFWIIRTGVCEMGGSFWAGLKVPLGVYLGKGLLVFLGCGVCNWGILGV